YVYRFASFEWPTYEGQRIPLFPFMPVRQLITMSNPDIIHVHSPLVLGAIAQIVAGRSRKPVIATNHYLPINVSPSLASHPLIGKRFSSLMFAYLVHFYNRCSYVTAPTATALKLLQEHGLRAPAQPMSCGIDLTRYTPGARDDQLHQRLHLPADRPL